MPTTRKLTSQLGKKGVCQQLQDEEPKFRLNRAGGAELAPLREPLARQDGAIPQSPLFLVYCSLAVLRVSLLKNRHIRVSVFPEGKEVLVDRR